MVKGLDYTFIDPWQATENLIRMMINSTVNTACLVEVTEVTKDKVSVADLSIPRESTVPPVVYHNVPVMMPSSGKLSIQTPLQKGDKGLLITCKLDISGVKKNNGEASTTNIDRVFDKNDSVFIPLFFCKKDIKGDLISLEWGEDKTNIKVKDNLVEITTSNNKVILKDGEVLIEGSDKVVIKGDTVELDSENIKSGAIKKAIDGLKARCDSLSSGMAGSGTNNVAYNTLKNVTEKALDPFQGVTE